MRINEIDRIPSSGFSGSDVEGFLGPARSEVAPKKPLPDDPRYTYSVFGDGIAVEIYDKNNLKGPDNPIAKLTCKELGPKFPLDNTIAVKLIGVDKNYRGQGLSKSLYNIVLSLLKKTLVAGHEQTPGGRRNWVSISQMPGVEVYGYVSIPAGHIEYDKKMADILMGQLGAQYIGEAMPYPGAISHFFAFPVDVNTKQNELEAIVKTKLSKVYNPAKNADWDVGLYAVFNR